MAGDDRWRELLTLTDAENIEWENERLGVTAYSWRKLIVQIANQTSEALEYGRAQHAAEGINILIMMSCHAEASIIGSAVPARIRCSGELLDIISKYGTHDAVVEMESNLSRWVTQSNLRRTCRCAVITSVDEFVQAMAEGHLVRRVTDQYGVDLIEQQSTQGGSIQADVALLAEYAPVYAEYLGQDPVDRLDSKHTPWSEVPTWAFLTKYASLDWEQWDHEIERQHVKQSLTPLALSVYKYYRHNSVWPDEISELEGWEDLIPANTSVAYTKNANGFEIVASVEKTLIGGVQQVDITWRFPLLDVKRERNSGMMSAEEWYDTDAR